MLKTPISQYRENCSAESFKIYGQRFEQVSLSVRTAVAFCFLQVFFH